MDSDKNQVRIQPWQTQWTENIVNSLLETLNLEFLIHGNHTEFAK